MVPLNTALCVPGRGKCAVGVGGAVITVREPVSGQRPDRHNAVDTCRQDRIYFVEQRKLSKFQYLTIRTQTAHNRFESSVGDRLPENLLP
jgi:hypothetical protein